MLLAYVVYAAYTRPSLPILLPFWLHCCHCCCRYFVGSAQLLRADVAAVQAACQLDLSTVCRMLLAAPRLVAVPASVWQLLLQYMLFLVPRWRQQVGAAH